MTPPISPPKDPTAQSTLEESTPEISSAAEDPRLTQKEASATKVTVAELKINLQQINYELLDAISRAKNNSFKEYASSLDHRNQNKNLYRAIKTIGAKPPSMIAQLALKQKSGVIVSSLKKKVEILSRTYQIP